MITLQQAVYDAILPALPLIGIDDSEEASVMLLAIGLQESDFRFPRQMIDGKPTGPATGYWQFERGGGVHGVLSHPASADRAIRLCKARSVEPESGAVWAQLEHDDILAAGFARLLLWTDPYLLPGLYDPGAAWECYERVWRPGKPHPAAWVSNHARAKSMTLSISTQ